LADLAGDLVAEPFLMKIPSEHSTADAKEKRRQGELGFTMVEIAMAIGVIGFALVAIIGILPAGMGVQQSNREDTIISQDAPSFLDAIRNGCVLNTNRFGVANQNLDFLTNYVEKIYFVTNFYTPAKGLRYATNYTFFNNTLPGWSGSNIVGLLSTPEMPDANYTWYLSTVAIVRSMSGPAVEQNGANLATAFRYQMTVEIAPFVNLAPDSTNFVAYEDVPNPDTNQISLRRLRWMEATPLFNNLYDIRLRFAWPVYENGTNITVGPNAQTYRSQIAARLLPVFINAEGFTNYSFQPLSYTKTFISTNAQ
jgi:type II secretory pathway pseudopilin PulG